MPGRDRGAGFHVGKRDVVVRGRPVNIGAGGRRRGQLPCWGALFVPVLAPSARMWVVADLHVRVRGRREVPPPAGGPPARDQIRTHRAPGRGFGRRVRQSQVHGFSHGRPRITHAYRPSARTALVPAIHADDGPARDRPPPFAAQHHPSTRPRVLQKGRGAGTKNGAPPSGRCPAFRRPVPVSPRPWPLRSGRTPRSRRSRSSRPGSCRGTAGGTARRRRTDVPPRGAAPW